MVWRTGSSAVSLWWRVKHKRHFIIIRNPLLLFFFINEQGQSAKFWTFSSLTFSYFLVFFFYLKPAALQWKCRGRHQALHSTQGLFSVISLLSVVQGAAVPTSDHIHQWYGCHMIKSTHSYICCRPIQTVNRRAAMWIIEHLYWWYQVNLHCDNQLHRRGSLFIPQVNCSVAAGRSHIRISKQISYNKQLKEVN